MKCILNKNIVNPLRKGWLTLLNRYEWTWFITLTFRDLPKTYTAINRAKQFLRCIEREEKCNIGYYLCMEYTLAGTPHFHALVGNVQGVRRLTWMDRWKYGYARIFGYDVNRGADYYLTKYTVKDEYQNGWYDIQGLQYCKQLTLDKING